MALPKIKQPIFELEIPSSGQKIRYRPFTVAEEKILLITKESDDIKDTINAYKAIVNNCCLDKIDVDKLCSFDLEYFFLNIRSKSVSNIVAARVKDEDDGQIYEVEVDLDKLMVSKMKPERLIKLTDDISVFMNYPTFDVIAKIGKVDETTQMLRTMIACIEQIYQGEEVFETSEYSQKDMEEFVLSMGVKELQKIKEFFDAMPKVYAEVKYKTKDGVEKMITLEGIQSFFD
jgi:hypothetical protein